MAFVSRTGVRASGPNYRFFSTVTSTAIWTIGIRFLPQSCPNSSEGELSTKTTAATPNQTLSLPIVSSGKHDVSGWRTPKSSLVGREGSVLSVSEPQACTTFIRMIVDESLFVHLGSGNCHLRSKICSEPVPRLNCGFREIGAGRHT